MFLKIGQVTWHRDPLGLPSGGIFQCHMVAAHRAHKAHKAHKVKLFSRRAVLELWLQRP